LKDTSLGQIGILGSGSWGTALAKILTDNGERIYWWVRNAGAVKHLQERHHNPTYLTAISFAPGTVMPSSDINAVVRNCKTLIVAVPSAYAQQTIAMVAPELWADKNIISAIKGILPECNSLLNDYLQRTVGFSLQRYGAISGPCHAEEVADERLSYLTFSGLNDDLTEAVAAAFKNTYINTTCTHDIWGAQFAAILKNIYAVGAGMAKALDYGDNFLSVYISNCYREMYGFLQDHFCKVNPDGERPDFHTSAYLGDLLVTCYSLYSRNRTFGSMIGKGYSVKAAILEMKMVAEGYYAARGMHNISRQHALNIPIADLIYQILYEDLPAAAGFLEIEKLLV
jgi:glycerol-3-phosphate dehydrogenase (NAD(P)+)